MNQTEKCLSFLWAKKRNKVVSFFVASHPAFERYYGGHGVLVASLGE